jgi:hypothetical protein
MRRTGRSGPLPRRRPFGPWAALTSSALAALTATACERRPRSLPIAVGQTVEGRLEPGDWTDVFADGSYTDLYELRLAAGQRVAIELRSTELDTYLSLMRGPGDQVVDNDDASADQTNSRLEYTSETSRAYFVAATTFRAGASGVYELTVREAVTTDRESAPEPATGQR